MVGRGLRSTLNVVSNRFQARSGVHALPEDQTIRVVRAIRGQTLPAGTLIAMRWRRAASKPCRGAKKSAARNTPACSSTMHAPVEAFRKKLTYTPTKLELTAVTVAI